MSVSYNNTIFSLPIYFRFINTMVNVRTFVRTLIRENVNGSKNIQTPEEKLKIILSSENIRGKEDLVKNAFDQACSFFQKIKEPDRIFPLLGISNIVIEELNLGAEPVAAIFLENFTGKSDFEEARFRQEWGTEIMEIILGLQKINRLDTNKYSSNAENFIKLLLTLSDDIRVILIHLAERLYNLRHIEEYPHEKQHLYVGESSFLLIPITHRIGLYRIKTEMEDRVMRFNEPETYQLLAQKLRETERDRDRYAKEFIRPLYMILQENGFDCEIQSRVKSIPSICRKMKVQKVEFDQVYDLFAIRIILNNTLESEKADCWKVYSLVTEIYTPNPRRLRDWISFPKSTGYESLHTTVIGPEGRWVEVQIRTRRMDEIAEKSFAAHWKYKEGKKSTSNPEFFAAIRDMLEKSGTGSGEKQVSREKRGLYTDEIFIFTPKGDLKKLKKGETVLDFAFDIHSEVGITCTGAIVNGIMVPLKHPLNNGDTVKILTSKNQKPSKDWVDYVKSPRNLARIRHLLKMEIYKESEFGKEIIRNKVLQIGMEFTDPNINKLISYFGCENILDLYQKFGEGRLDPIKIKKALTAPGPPQPAAAETREEFTPRQITEVATGKEDFIVIDRNIHSIHYEFAKCCNPVPGDKIFAFVSVSQGIRIHKTNCRNAHQLITRYPYRIMEARWREQKPDK
ncbi:MAG: TGS domain-containing protein [Bacteroidota bacterium]|nr:TGS domain-containing protein [Bacteroidota bacterium]